MNKESRQSFSGALDLPRLVGREDIIKQVKASLPPKNLQVFYLEGPGGIGKTRLLKEVMHIARECARQEDLVVPTELVDLYHYSTHSVEGLVQAIHAVLPSEYNRFFWDYEDKVIEMRGAHQKGAYEQAAELRKQVQEVFQTSFQDLAKNSPVVLTFDTLEVLSRSGPAGEEVLRWLASLLVSLEGQVLVLIAGRPDSHGEGEAEKRLQELFGSHLRALDVEGFSSEEVTEYLKALKETLEKGGERRSAQRLEDIPSEMRETIAILTAGCPILIALTADLILGPSQIQKVFPESPEVLQALSEDEKKEKQRETRKKIINHLRSSRSRLQETLDMLSLTRKGMSVELLAYLQRKPPLVAEKRLKEIHKFLFIKLHTTIHDNVTFLHDEMYDLLEENAPNPLWRTEQIERIVSWYREEIQRIVTELQEARESRTSSHDVENLQQKTKNLQVELLHYLLRKDVFEGMTHFVERSLDAYFSWDTSWDAHLESEVIEFLQTDGDFPLRRALEWETTLTRVRWSIRQQKKEVADALLKDLEAQKSPDSLHTAHRGIWRARFHVQLGHYSGVDQIFEHA
ncbi:MAG: ATP-binding protein, partial [bacterium]|nr:ATP-binding protein [bacterium]